MILLELRESARSKADEQATGFVTDEEVNAFINQGHRFVYGKIVQAFEDFFVRPGTPLDGGEISVSANQIRYPLPESLIKLVKAEYRDAHSTDERDWSRLPRVNLGNDFYNSQLFPSIERGALFGYFVAGGSLYLKPAPTQGASVRLWYVPRAKKLVNDTDQPEAPEEYHDLIAEHAAMQILTKSGEGILPERKEQFTLELNNLLETITHRVIEPQQMVISEEGDCW